MPARVVIDRDAYAEKRACLLEDGVDQTTAAQQAAYVGYNTPFALAATALANGDQEPAKELCRREMGKHGRDHALQLMRAIQEAVKDSLID